MHGYQFIGIFVKDQSRIETSYSHYTLRTGNNEYQEVLSDQDVVA